VQFIATANHSGASQVEMGGACGTYGGEEQGVQDLLGKPEVKRLSGRPRRRLESNTIVDIEAMGGESVDGISS
jgi:hypothetical protein